MTQILAGLLDLMINGQYSGTSKSEKPSPPLGAKGQGEGAVLTEAPMALAVGERPLRRTCGRRTEGLAMTVCVLRKTGLYDWPNPQPWELASPLALCFPTGPATKPKWRPEDEEAQLMQSAEVRPVCRVQAGRVGSKTYLEG